MGGSMPKLLLHAVHYSLLCTMNYDTNNAA